MDSTPDPLQFKGGGMEGGLFDLRPNVGSHSKASGFLVLGGFSS